MKSNKFFHLKPKITVFLNILSNMSKKYHVRKEYYSVIEVDGDEDLGHDELIEKVEEENNIEGEWEVHWDVHKE